MICHGLTGYGDGPRSVGIDAVNIIEHVPLHADLEYFEIVAAHADRGDLNYSTSAIGDEDIWHLVNYLHAFEADQLLAEEYFAQARDLAEQGDFAGALALLDRVIDLSPRFAQALLGRGIIALDQGNMAQAIADLDRIIALDPSYADGFYFRAEAYRLSGQKSRMRLPTIPRPSPWSRTVAMPFTRAACCKSITARRKRRSTICALP